jgi:hypothetical protein
MMMPEYLRWRMEHYPTPESACGACREATLAMVRAFPKLRRVKGHALTCDGWRPHWWCVTANGEVVDPTAHQWPFGAASYQEVDNEEPIGECIECGEYCFESKGDNMHLCAECVQQEDDGSDGEFLCIDTH